MMEFWIIRQIATGDYLPEIQGQRGGYTHTEPQGHGVPRLFLSAAAARRALTWWLKGATSVYRTQSSNPESYGEYEEDWTTTVEEHRRLEDMEIVSVVLKL